METRDDHTTTHFSAFTTCTVDDSTPKSYTIVIGSYIPVLQK